jgi:RNA-directed DNA polymerase
MGKKHRNLIGRIADPDNLRRAYHRTARGKRGTLGYLEFKEFAPLNLRLLRDEIADGSYRPGAPRTFTVLEPKPRLITALPFRDRVAQHALVAVIGPIFEATLLPRTFACREGMGTHAGAARVQADMRRLLSGRDRAPLYALKTDFAKYFPSIDRAVLHGLIRRKVSCAATLDLIAAMVPQHGRGLPIGSLTSQLFANVYGGEVDRHIHMDLGHRRWVRYMDDIVVLEHDPARLRQSKASIEAFAGERLGLRLSKWSIQSVSRGVNFLGYRIWPGHKLLRRQSVVRARRKLRRLRAGGDIEALRRFVAAWRGHAGHADSHNLLVSLKLRRRSR